MNSYKKTLLLFGTYSVLTSVLFIDAIFALFVFNHGLSITQLMLIGTISGITVILMEIPAGIISDKYSRKVSLIISVLLRLISIVFYIFGSFYVGSVLMALGVVFLSGTDSAYLYDMMKKYKHENEFQEIDGRIRGYTFYYMGFAAIISGILYGVNIYLPFIMTIGTFLCALIISINLEDEVRYSQNNRKKGHFEIIKTSTLIILKTNKVLNATLSLVLIMSVIQIVKAYDQPFMYEIQISSTEFGFIFFILNITAGFFSKRSKQISLKLKDYTNLVLILGFSILTFMLYILNNFWGLIILVALSVVRGIASPYFYTKLNDNIPSENRATILSCASLLISLFIALISPLTGLIADNFGLKFTYLSISCLIIVFSTILFLKNKFNIKKNEIVRDTYEN